MSTLEYPDAPQEQEQESTPTPSSPVIPAGIVKGTKEHLDLIFGPELPDGTMEPHADDGYGSRYAASDWY